MLTPCIFLVFGFVCLIFGADWFVEGAVGIAKKLRIPQLVIGLTIVAMGTSAPEAAVSISAALKGNAAITIGNVVGSNLLNVGIILGIAALIRELHVAKTTVRYELPFLFGVTGLLLGLGASGGHVTLGEGLLLWAVFLAYLCYLFLLAARQKDKPDEGASEGGEPASENESKKTLRERITEQIRKHPLLGTVIGLAVVIWGSDLTVDGATELARMLGISERIIGLTIVALGTSLPELVTSIAASRKGNSDIAVGNIVGSNIFNILFVVGTTSLIVPVSFARSFLWDTAAAAGSTVLLWSMVCRKRTLTRAAGAVLLLTYLAYAVFLMV